MLKKIDPESAGAYFGIAGALVLALAIPASKWGGLLFLAPNFFWLVFAYQKKFQKMFRQTVVFAGTSLLGILNSFYPGNLVQATITQMAA